MKKTIFYVEDNEDFLNLVLATIPKTYNCVSFTDPEAALERVFAGEHPDVIITDLKMPKKSGIEFIVQLRAYGYRNPIIIATGHIEREELIVALRLGICDVLDKPFSLEAFFAALDRAENELEMQSIHKLKSIKLNSAISCLEEAMATPQDAQTASQLKSLAAMFKEEYQVLDDREKSLRHKSPIDDILDPQLSQSKEKV